MATDTTTTTAPRAHLTTIALGAVTAAVILLAAWALTTLRAEAANTPDDATFVPITPCRLLDTRPATNVGPRDTPLGTDETHTVQVTGTNGDCQIPTTATAVAINLTGVRATNTTYIAVYPADADNPGTSALNLAPGQPATPNKIDVKLSPTGQLALYNRFGTAHLIGDVLGYYQTTTLTELTDRITALEAASGTGAVGTEILDRLDTLEAENAELRNRLANVSLETVDGHPTVRFTGVNVQIVDGTGATDRFTNGRGNLIVGYNEHPETGGDRSGSHNLVVGTGHEYSSYGGAVLGRLNTISTAYANVLGGTSNTAESYAASVLGGQDNIARGRWSTVSGGDRNLASGEHASVSGGYENWATGEAAAVSGGIDNMATGRHSSVSGGVNNTASGEKSSVSGGGTVHTDLLLGWKAGSYSWP